MSFESEAESLSEEGEADISGIYDDADFEQYNQVRNGYLSFQAEFSYRSNTSDTSSQK